MFSRLRLQNPTVLFVKLPAELLNGPHCWEGVALTFHHHHHQITMTMKTGRAHKLLLWNLLYIASSQAYLWTTAAAVGVEDVIVLKSLNVFWKTMDVFIGGLLHCHWGGDSDAVVLQHFLSSWMTDRYQECMIHPRLLLFYTLKCYFQPCAKPVLHCITTPWLSLPLKTVKIFGLLNDLSAVIFSFFLLFLLLLLLPTTAAKLKAFEKCGNNVVKLLNSFWQAHNWEEDVQESTLLRKT